MLFYPSHDIALANGVRHFNPPQAALRLQEDLASLSDIWNEPFLCGDTQIPQPWGWDWDTRKYIHETYRIKSSQLPTDEELANIRELSSRKTSILLLERLKSLTGEHNFPVPEYLQTEEEVALFLSRNEDCVLKTPWSSSGRGLMRSTAPQQMLKKHVRATLQRMGGIMGEPWINDKVQDFAMLFFVSDHDVRFIGYSLFDNDGTTYRQGHLLSNEKIVSRLGVEPSTLTLICNCYITILTELFSPFFGRPWQLGFVGIDMMTYNKDNSLKISPCVEMNLRCTMGVVCRLWYDKHQQEGLFRISPMEKDGHFKAQFLTHPAS